MTVICSNGSLLSSKASNDRRWKLVTISSSWMSLAKDNQTAVGLVDPSSLDYWNYPHIFLLSVSQFVIVEYLDNHLSNLLTGFEIQVEQNGGVPTC